MKSYTIIGLGRFGTQLAIRLFEAGNDVLAVDTNADRINEIADQVTRAVIANAKDKEILKKLGAADCDCTIVAVGSDLAASVLITMNLKSLNAPHIICKAQDQTYKAVLEKLGADQVIIPERDMANQIADSLMNPNILDCITLSDDYNIVEIKTPASWVGKSLLQLNIRADHKVTVIAVKDDRQTYISPGADFILNIDTTMVLLGDTNAIKSVQKTQ